MIEVKGNFGKRFIDIYGGKSEKIQIEKALEKIDEIDNSNKTISQIFDANNIVGKKHLLHASKLALEAIENDQSFADSQKIELTCWVAGRRQIDKAIRLVGVKKDSKKIALITIGKDDKKVKETRKRIVKSLNITREGSVFEMTDKKKEKLIKIYSISDKSLKNYSIEELILENTALLSLEI